jgi:hypothetical protein
VAVDLVLQLHTIILKLQLDLIGQLKFAGLAQSATLHHEAFDLGY